MKARLADYFADYASHHQHPMNQTLHIWGIGLIATTLLGLLGPVAATVVWIAVSAWYLSLDVALGLAFAAIALVLGAVAVNMPVGYLWGLFVFGWILQGVGHYYYEKSSPAFFKNLAHLLIGPLWIVQKLTRLAK